MEYSVVVTVPGVAVLGVPALGFPIAAAILLGAVDSMTASHSR